MILDKKFSFEFFKKNKNIIYKKIHEKSIEKGAGIDELDDLLDYKSKSKYLFSKPVVETLDSIKIKDEFDCNILRERKTVNGIIFLNEFEFYIFNTKYENLRVIFFNINIQKDFFDVKLFTFKIKENKKVVSVDISSEVWKRFLQSIIYLDFLPTEVKYILPNSNIGKTRKDKVVNKTDSSFILVTKAWNQEYKSLPNTKFFSREHWAIRWSGVGRVIPKMTFIKASFKELNKQAEKEIKR